MWMHVLRKLWHAWRRFGQFLGDVVARVVLTLFYFTLFVPFGIGVTWFSDPLQARASAPAGWRPRHASAQAPSIEDARRQF
jgi:hypothetical protein